MAALGKRLRHLNVCFVVESGRSLAVEVIAAMCRNLHPFRLGDPDQNG